MNAQLLSPVRDSVQGMARGMALLLFIRVCSDGTEEETLDWLRTNHPAGTENNWQISEEENRRPVPCAEDPDKKTHYFFVC